MSSFGGDGRNKLLETAVQTQPSLLHNPRAHTLTATRPVAIANGGNSNSRRTNNGSNGNNNSSFLSSNGNSTSNNGHNNSSGNSSSFSYRRAKALLENLSRSITATASASNSFLQSPMFGPLANQNSLATHNLAMSLSRSLGRSWSRDTFLETLTMHLDTRSPFLPPSPSRDLQQFAQLEDQFCKDFSCCGVVLDSMHDLLQHYEEYHVRVESVCDDDNDDEDDDDDAFDLDEDDDNNEQFDHLPFGIDCMEDDDMEMDEFDIVSAQQQQEFNTAFLRAQIAAMSTNNTPQKTNPTVASAPTSANQQFSMASAFSSPFNLQHQPQTPITRATVSSVLGTPSSRMPLNNQSPFSLIQKHDNQVEDFRITPQKRSQSEQHHPSSSSSIANSTFSAFDDTVVRKRTQSNILPPQPPPTMSSSSLSSSLLQKLPASSTVTPLKKSYASVLASGLSSSNVNPTNSSKVFPFYDATQTRLADPEDSDYESTNDDEIVFGGIRTGGGGSGFGGRGGSGRGVNLNSQFKAVAALEEINLAKTAVTNESADDDLEELLNSAENVGPAPTDESILSSSFGIFNESAEDRPFKCKIDGCGKEYKNSNGLKYHMRNSHPDDTGDPEINNAINKPYMCVVDGCGKRYKNLNGLKVG
ncbi:Transcriptional regulator of ribosomal biogenesis proteins [Physocladia obscura]|uniref:Transcriptional regulator of ribosomal biogenesis proteins n=1 Tax=Physocladia obscura TaxID=109957 RepID=A0AAD5XJL4_9FUNG|nr:Transcriptional regulator of ribosomal biogenesis proteins [Physocladia obscura]